MTISVIIPTYNGAHKLGGVLDSLKRQTRMPDEVLVVVDGSTDSTAEVLRDYAINWPGFRVILQPNQGRARVRNRGAAEAKGDLFIFLDDDMLPEPDCVRACEERMKLLPGVILAGKQSDICEQTDFQRFRKSLSGKWEKPLLNLNGQPIRKDLIYLSAANFCIEKASFEQLGGFDPRLSDAEDFDLAVRAFELGIPIYYHPEAMGYHNDPVTGASYIRRLRQYRKAHQHLRKLEPRRYAAIPFHEPTIPGGIKGFCFRFFARACWVKWLDRQGLKWMIPRSIRYRIYDWVITANGSFFPERVKL